VWLRRKLQSVKHLVTVTCNKERNLMLLQAESIQKFLEPCCHWVIVNEINVDVEAWKEILNPFYDRHELKIIPQHLLFENKENIFGQYTQQVCKLTIAKMIKDDYLILDSKNFFIRPSSINEWDEYIGSGILEFINEPPDDYNKYQPYKKGNDSTWTDAIEQYKNILDLKVTPLYFLTPITPFKIDYQVLENSNLLNDIFHKMLFVDDKIISYGASEFILYSFLANDKIIPGKNTVIDNSLIKVNTISYFHFDWYIKEITSIEHFVSKMVPPNIKVFGLHRKFLIKCGPEHIKIINRYLEILGFKFRFI